MTNLTYDSYLADYSLREEIIRAAGRARTRALRRYLFEPIANLCGKLLSIRGVRLQLDPRA
jgi:hypothetical protein